MDSRWEFCSETLADCLTDAPFSDSASGSGAGPCCDSTIDFPPFFSELEPWIDLRLGSLESCGLFSTKMSVGDFSASEGSGSGLLVSEDWDSPCCSS
jgi:hypothetical protein